MKEADTFLRLVLLITISANWCGGRSCDQRALNTCVRRYMLDISTRLLEGMSHVCHYENTLQRTLMNCIELRTAGCPATFRVLLEKPAESAHDSLFDVLKTMFCNPIPGCGIMDILECYKEEFDKLHIQQPYDMVNTPRFMDGLLTQLYRNQTAFCLSTFNVNFQSKVTCLTRDYRKLFEACKDDGVTYAGVTEQQSENIFKNAVGQLGDARLMEASVRSMCSGGCDNFVDRYHRVQNCLKTFTSELHHEFTSMVTNDIEIQCTYLKQLYECTWEDMQGCAALANIFHGNRNMRDMMKSCRIYFSASAYSIYYHSTLLGVCLSCTLLVLSRWTSISRRIQSLL